MKLFYQRIFELVVFISSILFANYLGGIDYTAARTGNWNATNTWTPAGIPTNGDRVTIPNAGRTVTVPSGYTAECDQITFIGGNAASTIRLQDATSSLRVGAVSGTGNVNIGLPTNNRTKQINVGAGTFYARSLTLNGSSAGTNRTDVLISSGTVTITGDITSAGTNSRIIFSGAGTLYVGGTFLSGTQGTFTPATGTVVFNGASDQAVTSFPYNFYNLIIGGGGEKIISADITVSGTLNVLPGASLSLISANLNVLGNVVNEGSIDVTATNITVGGDWKNSGTFDAGYSNVIFNNAALTSTIQGDNTFYNLTCTTASKNIVFAQDSTQIVTRKFRIDGSAFATRVNLSSSGGTGTTWNLILNGTHDCRYVAVQGSKASGTAFLPVNPVGFKDNGDNTNWYDPDLPGEIIFYDNFETSTLASQPPDKTSSNWSIGGAGSGWFSEASVVVDTQNHTPGGSKSMYSRGGSAGQGVGAWNYPGWGPQTNCTAEAWFYDDMQNGKVQWIFADNAAGNQGLGVKIDTNRSTTKYVYCVYIGTVNYTVSFIDRTLGWHKVKWVHTDSGTELYLDDVLLTTAVGLTDFSDFDTGSWTWDNTSGSTPMWFDDFIVYRSQAQSRYRWYDNNNAQTPTALAGENTPVTNRNIGSITRLRLQIQNNQYEDWGNAYVTLQYRRGTNGEWRMLAPSEDWDWANGMGTDKAQVANALLTNTNVRQHFVESNPSQANLTMTTGQYGEWDFAIVSTSNANLATPYYFRAVITDSSGNYQRRLAAYQYYPQITLVSPTMTQWTGAVDTNWSNASNWTNGVPDGTKDAIIASSATRDCSINITGARAMSVIVQQGRTLNLGTAGTDLTVVNDMTVYGNVVHNNTTATLNVNSGVLLIDTTGRYNNSAGNLNCPSAFIRVINGGQFNVSSNSSILARAIDIEVGGLINITGAATFNLESLYIEPNGQWLCSNTGATINISYDFLNSGSMLGSTGGVFNFTSNLGTISGTSSSTTFYRLNINGNITNSITNNITIIDDFTIASTKSFSASSGNILIGGDFSNNGTFIHSSGTLTFNGNALQLVNPGSSDLYRIVISNSSAAGVRFENGFTCSYFTNTTPNSLITFTSGRTYNITAVGGLNLQGSAGNLIRLRSSIAGSQWIINPSGSGWTCDYLDVMDSVNIYQTTIYPTNSTDNGNNINWFSADKDNDELPDYWEYRYYTNLSNNASSDTDSDELNDLLEYIYDSDPTLDTSPIKIYVDANSSYTGMDGSETTPYKYLEDALNAAPSGAQVIVKEGIYKLTNYTLNKNLIITGENATKTIISGPYPSGSSSDTGQCLNVTSAKFAISNISFQNFREDQPVISYNVANIDGKIYMEGLIFTGNSTATKSLIAPIGAQNTTVVYLLNSLFYNNICAYVAEIKGVPAYIYHNTITSNSSGGIVLSGTGNTNIYNDIIRENSGAEITNNSSGVVSVYNSNIEGGFPGAINSYDSPETYIDSGNGVYRPASGTPAINAGIQTFIYADLAKIARPFGGTVDVGAYEFNPNDNDGDDISNAEETVAGTNPNNPDSDMDSLSDYEEINTYSTDPNLADTDGDGVRDGDEPAIGMNPALYDGILWVDMYDEGFEDPLRYPPDQPVSVSIWGADATYSGDIYTETGDSYTPGDNAYINFRGKRPESSAIMFITRNMLPEHWIAISYKHPRAKLPTNPNQALVISGAYFAVNENGYLCAYDQNRKDWIVYMGSQIPDNQWFRILVHRHHLGRYCDIYLDLTNDGLENGVLAFSNLPIYGPDLDIFNRC